MPKPCAELTGLTGPFTRIARAMSQEWNVRIVPSGATCSTDGEAIRIPFTADLLPEDKRQILHGMLDHEVCHVAEERRHRKMSRQTPFELLKELKDKRERLLLNVVEDIRIEHRYSAQYVGVAQNLAALNVKCASDWAEKHGQVRSWWKSFGAALISRAHGFDASWAENDFGEYLSACEEELGIMRDGVGMWCDASRDVVKRIFAKVKQKQEELDAQQPDEDEEDDDGEGGEGKKDDKHGGGGKCGSKQGGPDDDVDGSEDMLDEMRAELEEYVIHDAKEHDRYIPHPKAHALDEVEHATADMSVFASARSEVMPQIRALRQKQRALISTWARRRPRFGLDHGDIDEHVLADVRTGAMDVFSELTQKRALNTAILGLVDCSGSMGINHIPSHGAYYALRTAIALAETWSALRVPNEWLGFTAHDEKLTGITAEDLTGPYFCRPALRHIIFKSFDEPMRAARARFGAIQGHGSNVDGEAVLWAWQRLIVRREPRKILVVISDGMPSSWNGCDEEENREAADESKLQGHLRDVIKTVTQSGVECIGFGAGTATPRAFYNRDTGAKFVHVASITTLAFDVFRVMKERLTDLA